MNASQQKRQRHTRLSDFGAFQSKLTYDDGKLPAHQQSIDDSGLQSTPLNVIEDIPTTPIEVPTVAKQSSSRTEAFQRDIAQANTLQIVVQRSSEVHGKHNFMSSRTVSTGVTTPPEINAVLGQALHTMLPQDNISHENALHLQKPLYQNIRLERNTGNVPMTPSEMNAVLDIPAQKSVGAPIIQFPHSTEQRAWTSSNVLSEVVVQVPVTNIAKKKNKWLGLMLRIGCTVLLFVFLFKSFSWSSLIGVLKHVDQGQLLVGFIVGLFCVIVSAYQWRSLLHAEHIKFDLADLVDLYFVGIAFSHFLPTGMGGDAIKAMRVGDAAGNRAGSASAVVMSRLTGFFGMMFIGIPVLLIWHTYFNQTIVLWFFVLSVLVAGMIGGAVFFAVMLPRIVKGKWITHKVFQSGIKIGKALSVAMQRPRSLSIAILWGVIFWLCSCVNHYAYGIALGIHVPFFFYCVAVPFISLVTFLPISINGFGLREGAFVYIFSTMHVSPATALLLALLMDAQALLFGSLGGSLYLLTGGNKAKREKKLRAA